MRDQRAPIPRDLQGLWEDLQTDESDGQCCWTDISQRAVCALIERIAEAEARADRLEEKLKVLIKGESMSEKQTTQKREGASEN